MYLGFRYATISGVSVGSKIIGAEVSHTSNANLKTAVHASGTPITVTGNQTLELVVVMLKQTDTQ